MELTCALVLLIVGSVTAGPHGYGTKGGAVAKADARAVAGAYAGAGSLPLSIPSGSSYSGSFSQSSASSSSSSSSSSSAFTYSGSGVVGGFLPNGNACGSGKCNNGGATGAQGSAGAGSHAYNINAGSLAGGYGVKIPTGNYGHSFSNDNSQDNKNQDCGSQGCLGSDSNSLNANGAGYGLQSSSDAKATASAGAGNVNRCVSGECSLKAKCSSGNCEAAPHTLVSGPSQSDGPNKCTNGKCAPNQDITGSSLIDNDNNDINVHGSGSSNSRPSYGSDCTDGICDTSPASTSGYDKPALDLTVPKLEPACSGSNCYHSAPGYSPSGQTKVPYTPATHQNENQLGSVFSPGYGSPTKSTHAHGPLSSYSPKKPAGEAACAPGTLGCGITTPNSGSFDCTSGKCGTNPSAPGYYSPSSGKPSYSHEHAPSVTPSSQTCVSGTPGCNTPPIGNRPSDCALGNCNPPSSGHNYSGIKPIYSHESLPTFSSTKPSGADCAPGSPGCAISPSPSSPHECVSGNCHGYSSSTGYGGSSSYEPSFSHGTSVPYTPSNPSGCAPGTLGCGPNLSTPGYGESLNSIRPNYSNGVSPSHFSSIPPCSPGVTGCGLTSTTGSSLVVKPSYSYGSLSPNAPLKPPGSSCEPGSPGCTLTVAPSSPEGCTSGNCDEFVPLGGHGVSNIKPPYSQGSPTYFSVKPLVPSCVPGTPGCHMTSIPGCLLGNCGVYPTLQSCAPGTPGCSIMPSSIPYGALGHPTAGVFMPVSVISAPGYGSAGVGSSSNQGAYGNHGTGSYNKPSIGFSAPGSGSGTYTSELLPVPVAPFVESSPQVKDKPAYTGGFGGPAGLLKPNEYSAPSPTNLGNKPIASTTPATVDAGAVMPVSGISAPGYGSAGVGSSLNQGAYGTGSYNKPSTGFSSPGSGSGTYTPGFLPVPAAPSIESSSHLGTVEISSQSNDKPAYIGGFGGPAGLLNPNEYSAPSTTNYGNKPKVSVIPATDKPSCVSGICNEQAFPPYTHAGSATGAQAVAGASATADAVAYSGGFGGPPGFLLPHDNGKVDLKNVPGKQLTGSSHGLHQGADHSTYSNDGSSPFGSTVAHASAAAVSSAGEITVDKLHSGNNGEYSHGHDNAGGCGGGCGGSGAVSGSFGYGGSSALSKTGVLDGSSNGLAVSGAVAKTLANASSGARAFGSSYASSSATAHAGASVKGGYGRR